MTEATVRVTGAHERDAPRLVQARPEAVPWSGPRSLPLWDLLTAALAALVLSRTLVPAPTPVLVAIPLGWCVALQAARATETAPVGTLVHAARRLVHAGALVALAGCALSVGLGPRYTPGHAFLTAAACAGASLLARAMVWWAAGTRGVRGRPRVLVIGDDARQHAVAALERRTGPELSVVSVRLDSVADPAETPGVTSVPADGIASYAARIGACAVVVMPEAGLEPAGLRRLQWSLEAARLPLYVGPGLVGVTASRLEATDVDGLPLVRVHGVERAGGRAVLLDVTGRCVAAVALLVLLPLLAVLCLAIRRESPGPAIFRQQRVGRDGRTFTIYKLRTMGLTPPSPDELTNDADGVLFKMRGDPRVTTRGRWLRRYSLDELPQLLNVLLGHMRLVGPRPALPDEVAVYTDDMRRRLAVRPGITGLWQVSGRSDLTWEETVRLDLHYVDNWSPSLDLRILCRTVKAVLGHRGAY
ncbi:exopolysaccharide biosynthesis polyprenyl glycosylphosphotransferase [Nocardioides sp. cx-169]|uniref:exopolysaccharide biosynthesis polyprenyl glycosylphosphotransferase n=1 Tax=Nocardioides sp. cx-169 TaxID=2899080 RepID=UPI001E41E78C|nr:exopolysaccharide biosynthesis polyprenyl glycosylphosphotransferase [Nocardioides sp. cx-169]MCD4536324.1 exopolysaccharide biosynthesis polyprenyl glycosylphosphotransferase [Nocardioides sp. cx-169]